MNPLEAARELRENWHRWLALGRQLDQWETAAREAAVRALREERWTDADVATRARAELVELRREYAEADRRWRWAGAVVPYITPSEPPSDGAVHFQQGGQLGALPLWPLGLAAAAGAVVVVVGMVRRGFARAGMAQRIMDALEGGQLTPDQAERLLRALRGGTVGVTALVAVGVALVALHMIRGR